MKVLNAIYVKNHQASGANGRRSGGGIVTRLFGALGSRA
jgi:hypothetical protein